MLTWNALIVFLLRECLTKNPDFNFYISDKAFPLIMLEETFEAVSERG